MFSVTEPIALHYDGEGFALIVSSTETSERHDRAGLVSCVELAPGLKVDTNPKGEILSVWVRSRPFDDAEATDHGEAVTMRLFYPPHEETREDANGAVRISRCVVTGWVAAVTVLHPCR